MGMLKKVVFLDRDGVINRDSPGYIKSWDEFEFLPGSIEAIKHLTTNSFDVIIISNQSAVNRNLITVEGLEHIFTMMKTSIEAEGGRIKDIFYCPHRPDEGCECRKPSPHMIITAKQAYNIDLSTSYMGGDNAKEIECARNAGCGNAVLVRTGNGLSAEKSLAEKKIFPDHIADNLSGAVHWIINHNKTPHPAA